MAWECSQISQRQRSREEFGSWLTDVEVKEGNLREDEGIIQGHEDERLDQDVQQMEGGMRKEEG